MAKEGFGNVRKFCSLETLCAI